MLWPIQLATAVCIHALISTHQHVSIYIGECQSVYTCPWLLSHDSGRVATETTWFAKAESLTIWPFTEICQLPSQTKGWSRGTQSMRVFLCFSQRHLTVCFWLCSDSSIALPSAPCPCMWFFGIVVITVGFALGSSLYILQHVKQHPTPSKCIICDLVGVEQSERASEKGGNSESRKEVKEDFVDRIAHSYVAVTPAAGQWQGCSVHRTGGNAARGKEDRSLETQAWMPAPLLTDEAWGKSPKLLYTCFILNSKVGNNDPRVVVWMKWDNIKESLHPVLARWNHSVNDHRMIMVLAF